MHDFNMLFTTLTTTSSVASERKMDFNSLQSGYYVSVVPKIAFPYVIILVTLILVNVTFWTSGYLSAMDEQLK